MATSRRTPRKSLTDYPRPSVAVDTAVLTVVDGTLSVVVVDDARDGTRRLPGTFLHEGELLADAVRRSLRDKAGVSGLEPAQLHVFDALDRDDRGRVLSVAHMAAVSAAAVGEAQTVPVERIGRLAFDHEQILALAVERLRREYSGTPDPWRLLGERPITLRELEDLHRAVDPATPLRDSFRRAMEPHLTPTGEVARGTVGKPARLFTLSTPSPTTATPTTAAHERH